MHEDSVSETKTLITDADDDEYTSLLPEEEDAQIDTGTEKLPDIRIEGQMINNRQVPALACCIQCKSLLERNTRIHSLHLMW